MKYYKLHLLRHGLTEGNLKGLYIGSGRDVYESSLSIQQRARNKYIEIASRFDNIEIIKCTQDGTMLAPEHISECVVSSLIKHGII